MAGNEEDDGFYDDDVLFDDDFFLSAIASVEAQHLGRLTNVLSCDDLRGGEQQMSGANRVGEVLHNTGKRNIQREQSVDGRFDQPLRGEASSTSTSLSGDYFVDDVRKRRRTEDDSRTGWPTISSGQENETRVGAGRLSDAQPEGEYMAALRGSNSELWQSSTVEGRGTAGFSSRTGTSGNVASGGDFRSGISGTCYKCGMEGHWAKECTGAKGVATPTSFAGKETPNVPERLCACGAGPCAVLTANTEKNPGRSFYKCPLRKEEGQCTFFEWCDTGGKSILSERANWQALPQQPQVHAFPQQTQLQCKCGSGPCAILTAKTEKNMGRQFYRCPLPQGQGCSFFQWCDEIGKDGEGTIPSTPSRAPNYPGNLTGPAPASGNCFKCGQEGHWSRDCPNQQAQHASNFGGLSQSYNSSGPTESRNLGNCYKCGGQGHWSNSCPSSGVPAGQSYAKPGDGGPISGGKCYKCGDSGHWANRCPLAPGGQR